MMAEPSKSQSRLLRRWLASLSLLVIVIGCFGIGFITVTAILLFLKGGIQLLREVWAGTDDVGMGLILISGATGGMGGMFIGIIVWGKLLIKTKLLTPNEIGEFTGAYWLASFLGRR